MTPTLAGRWQTRIFLMLTFGLLITLIFGLIFNDLMTVYALLGYVLVAGLGLDVFYNWWQSRRWEYDWPPLLFFISGLIDGAVVWLLASLVDLPGVAADLSLGMFLAHYGTVWLVLFIIVWGPMKVFFPKWRFRGGRIV